MHHRSNSGMQEVIQMCSSFDSNKSTKGASKLRRDLINSEIANLRDLLPLPSSTRQRLSQLQLMALVCVFVRKSNYFQQVFKRQHELGHPYSTPNIGFSKALSGFLIMMTQNGKLLYISDNAAEYLGHSMEDLLIHGDSVYDIIDKADHGTVQSELLRGGTAAAASAGQNQPSEDARIFLCRMNVSRNARRQMRFGDQKVVLLQGRYLSYLPLCSRNEPVFVAACTPVAMPETRECVVQGATNVFTTIHAMDMKFMHIDRNAEYYLGYTRPELGGISWYQLIHWNYMREAQSKHRLREIDVIQEVLDLATGDVKTCNKYDKQLISQSEQEKSCILLLRLQTRSGGWIWVHCVLQVKDASDSSSSSSSSSSAQQQQQQSQQPSQSVIVATNQILSEREAAVMRANSWLYHYYTVQTKLQYGLAYPEAVAASQGSPAAAATAAARLAAAAYFPTPQLMNYAGHPHHHLHHHHHPHHPHAHQLTSAAESGGYAAVAAAAAAAVSMPPPLHSPAHNGSTTTGAYGSGATAGHPGYLHSHHPPTHHPHSHHPHHSPFEMASVGGAGKDSPLDFSLAASALPFDYQMSAGSYGAAAAYWSHHHHHHSHHSSSTHGYGSATAPPTGSGGTIGSQRSTGSEGSPSNSSTISTSATSPHTWSLQQNPLSANNVASVLQHSPSGKTSGSSSVIVNNNTGSTSSGSSARKRMKKESIVATSIAETALSPPLTSKSSDKPSRSLVNVGGSNPLTLGGSERGDSGSGGDCSVATLSTPFPYHNRYRNAYKLFGSSTISSSLDDDQTQMKEENLTMSCPLTPSPVWEGQTHRVPDLQFYNVERDVSGHHGVMTGTDLIHCVPTYQPYLPYCTPPTSVASLAGHHPSFGGNATASLGHVNGATSIGLGVNFPMGLGNIGTGHLHNSMETSLSESGSPNKENRLPPTPESEHGENDENRPIKWESL